MEITGRVTGDARVKKAKDNMVLVAFTIVDNQRYKTKAGEKREVATFFNCDYWASVKVAPCLRKGTIVTLCGMVGIHSYQKSDGDFIAQLTFHTDNIKTTARGKSITSETTRMNRHP